MADYVSLPAPTNADGSPPATSTWVDSILGAVQGASQVATGTLNNIGNVASTWKELVAPVTAVQAPAFGLGSTAPGAPPPSTPASPLGPQGFSSLTGIFTSTYFLGALAVGLVFVLLLKRRK